MQTDYFTTTVAPFVRKGGGRCPMHGPKPSRRIGTETAGPQFWTACHRASPTSRQAAPPHKDGAVRLP